jgi:hypothetical protein
MSSNNYKMIVTNKSNKTRKLSHKRNSYESEISKTKNIQFCSNTSNFSLVTQERSPVMNTRGKIENTSKHISTSSINQISEDKKEHNDTKQTFQSDKDQKDTYANRRFSILDIPGNIQPIISKKQQQRTFQKNIFKSMTLKKLKCKKQQCLLLLASNK